MKKIKVLIAIDYALSAQSIAEKGYHFATSLNADVVLMHVIENVVYYSTTRYDPIMGFDGFLSTDFLGENVSVNLEKEADVFLNKVKHHLGNHTIKTIVETGDVSTTIIDTAKKIKADIIVIGTKSRRGFDEILLGNTSHQLVKHSSIPMYIIPIK